MASCNDPNNSNSLLPVIGITMGEPAGIGPEVVVKALADPAVRAKGRFVIYGLNEMLTYAADLAEINPFWWRVQHERTVNGLNSIIADHPVVVADYDEFSILGTAVKEPTKAGGEASMRFCVDAIDAARSGVLDAIVTAPISKRSWQLAGYKFAGHTELLAKRCRAKRVAMMFAAGPLRVALATIHEPLFEIRHRFTIGCVFTPIDLLNDALKHWFGIKKPRIAVAALNPHASENGRFGDEEQRIIKPAILMAQEAGIDCEGPLPADSLFVPANSRRYDGIVAMYHDQGLIPIKMHAFNEAVNLTLGLPIVRTSVDHGTAFDIVGQNVADPGSMKAAITMAARIARIRRTTANAPR